MAKAVVKFNPLSGEITYRGTTVSMEILQGIFESDARVLWHFRVVDGELIATPYGEKEVIWLDRGEA